MSILKKISRSNFLIKLRSWEYWPFGILQLPVFFYYFWLSIKARSLVFFSASNPAIPMGGMFGESKFDILEKIPTHLKPKTIKISSLEVSTVVNILKENGFVFPVIFKPNIGERGFQVKKISTITDIESYIRQAKGEFIVQELIDFPLEFGVLYERLPSEKNGQVTSIVMKEMLCVTGDGKQTLKELILQQDRAKLQWSKLRMVFHNDLECVVPKGKKVELVSIGNHALGTKFLNGNHLIDEQLSTSFDKISKMIDEFYFGRYDLRCQTIDDLKNGNVKILELNGCGAEPAHIYDPDFKLLKAVSTLLRHWRVIYEISSQNRKAGASYVSLKEGIAYYRLFKKATR